MQRTLKDIIFDFLTIVEYPNDREKFFAEFEELNRIEALANIFETLPKEVQEKIKELKEDNLDEISHYIPKEAYEQELTRVASLAFGEQIKETLPLVTPEQKEKIVKLVASLQENDPQQSEV